MKIIRLIPFLAFLTIIASLPASSQDHNQNKLQHNKVDAMKHGRDCHAKTVVFKIKPEFRSVFENKDAIMNAFAKFKNEINITSIKKRFPTVNSPKKEHNHLGQKMVDLSLVYELKYSGDFTIEDVIKKISQTGIVVYSEPSFVNKILYYPNDPLADSINNKPGAVEAFYLNYMKYFQALDITQGDTNMVIGIVDTGTNYNHEDLTNSVKYNYADPINGADDDNDGYTDNFRGWDIGMNDNDPYATGNEHGTIVSGCAAATIDNHKGIVGIGGKCKYLPIKATTDDPNSSLIGGYDGLIYAVQHNCKVVNLSWGGAGSPSQYDQDVINYAAINYDAVIVAAAGNDNSENDYYPASYDNVLSVAALQMYYNSYLDSVVEGKADFATYSYYVDVVATGRRITSTVNDGTYLTGCVGSSFSSPLVAGAAALVRTKFPSLTALQIAERLRVTADPLIDTIPQNIYFKQEKLGKGRINIYRALTDTVLPSIRMISNQISNKYSKYAFAGDTAQLVCKFRNYLQKTNNAVATLTVVSGSATVVQGTYTIGVLNTLDSTMNNGVPFKLFISPTAQLDQKLVLRIGFADPTSGYTDYQYFNVIVNPSYINIDTNQVTVTVTSNGRIGFVDDFSSVGVGIVYKGLTILSESGLMIGTGPTKVSDCVRSSPAPNVDHDFTYIQNQKYTKLSEGDKAARAILTDTNSTSRIGIKVEQRSYAFAQSPDDKYVIVEYDITNISGSKIDSIYVGLFSDWDIQNYGYNKANYSSPDSMGYVYYTGVGGIYAGTCLLTNNSPVCYSIENGNTGGTNINPNDGFTTVEKFYTLSHGIGRAAAGGSGVGYDVSQVVGGGLRNLLANEKRTVAFAIIVGDNLTDLRTSAQRARKQFRYYNTSPTPVIATQNFCKGDTVDVTIAPTNGTKFNFYSSPASTTPVYTGASYSLAKVYQSDTLYVRGIDSIFESGNTLAKIIIHGDLKADFSFAPKTIDLGTVPYGFFISTSQNASVINWNMGDGRTYNDTTEVLHKYTLAGNYNVVLTAKSIYNCIDSISQLVKVIGVSGVNPAMPDTKDGVLVYPNPASDYINIQFALANPQQVSIQILDAVGQQVEFINAETIQNSNYVISFEGKEKGMYYAKINIGEKIITRKFNIQ